MSFEDIINRAMAVQKEAIDKGDYSSEKLLTFLDNVNKGLEGMRANDSFEKRVPTNPATCKYGDEV